MTVTHDMTGADMSVTVALRPPLLHVHLARKWRYQKLEFYLNFIRVNVTQHSEPLPVLKLAHSPNNDGDEKVCRNALDS
jgi:hypothetical protein